MSDPLNSLGPDRPRYDDFPDFEPDFSPGRMLAIGVFDGGYFNDAGEDELEGIDEKILDKGPYDEEPDAEKYNQFGVHAGQSREKWQEKGWIRDQDPLGWFQWFCRFHSGRRSDDDDRQVKRWLDFRKRWKPNTEEALENMSPGAKTRQSLLHWAIDPYLPEHSLGVEVSED